MTSSVGGDVIKTAGLVSGRLSFLFKSVLSRQASGGSFSQSGPSHHRLKLISWRGVEPLEAMSAGLHCIGTCLH